MHNQVNISTDSTDSMASTYAVLVRCQSDSRPISMHGCALTSVRLAAVLAIGCFVQQCPDSSNTLQVSSQLLSSPWISRSALCCGRDRLGGLGLAVSSVLFRNVAMISACCFEAADACWWVVASCARCLVSLAFACCCLRFAVSAAAHCVATAARRLVGSEASASSTAASNEAR